MSGTGVFPVAARRAALALVAVAVAGQAPAADLTEIVVTTRKVEENLREVPLAITAFDAGTIEAAGIDSLDDVAALTPGLQFFNPLGETLPVPIIRGVAPLDIRDSENNTAIFVDGVYVSGREGLNFSQLDIERIEVVKGPQSALYGRNAFSGAINYVTRRPADVFEARAETTLGNRGKLLAKGSASGPIIDGVLGYRFGVLYDDWDGSYDNPISSEDVGGYNYRTVQGSLRFTPTERFDALLSVYVSRDEIDDSATVSIPLNCEDSALFDPRYQDEGTGVPFGSNLANHCGKVPDLESYWRQAGQPYGDDEIPKIAGATGEERDLLRVALTVDWDLDYGTLSFLSGFTDTEQDATLDFGRGLGYDVPFVYCSGANLGLFCTSPDGLQRFTAGTMNYETGNQTQEFSQEIRFTSPQDRTFRYVTGLFYYTVDRDEFVGDPRILGDLPADFAKFCPCLETGPGLYFAPFGDAIFLPTVAGPVQKAREQTISTDSWAVFGALEYDIIDGLTARVEGRYAWQEVTQRLFGDALNDPVVAARYPQNGKENWDAVTGRLSLNWKVNDDWIIYSSIANAEKSGSFDGDARDVLVPGSDPLVCPDEVCPDVPLLYAVEPEKNVTMELGAKGVTSDGFLALDIAIYRIDWQDMVLPEIITVTPQGDTIVDDSPAINANIGDATIRGWEASMAMRFSEAWSLRLTGAYTDAILDQAKISSFNTWPSFQPDGDVSGNQVLRVSPWQFSGSLNYRQQVMGDWEFYGRGDVIWRDSWYIGNDNQGVIPAHTYVNLRFGLESARYSVEVWADNVFEDDNPVGAYRDIFWTNTQDVFARNDPPTSTFADFPTFRMTTSLPRLRTFGITGRVRFGGAVR